MSIDWEDLHSGACPRDQETVDADKLAERILAAGEQGRINRKAELDAQRGPSPWSGLPQGYGDPRGLA